jgi:hypothetical protein
VIAPAGLLAMIERLVVCIFADHRIHYNPITGQTFLDAWQDKTIVALFRPGVPTEPLSPIKNRKCLSLKIL